MILLKSSVKSFSEKGFSSNTRASDRCETVRATCFRTRRASFISRNDKDKKQTDRLGKHQVGAKHTTRSTVDLKMHHDASAVLGSTELVWLTKFQMENLHTK